jgi:hypothetical protein
MRRGRWGVLAAGAAAVSLVWLVHQPSGVPLYDGIGFPDQPYRYVDPPPGYQKTPPPSTAVDRSAVSGGTTSGLLFAQSAESGPQIVVSMPSHALAAPQATKVTLEAKPLAPDNEPHGATINGNVYQVTWTADRGTATPTSRIRVAYVLMRATSGKQPGPTMYHRTSASAPWTAITTARVGNDIYQSPLPSEGDYALAFSNTGGSSSGSLGVVIGVVVGALVVLAVLILLVRLRRRGSAAPT